MTFGQFRCVDTLQKFFLVLMWGPIFVGAPVRPNMLNIPKPASVYTVVVRLIYYRSAGLKTD